MRLVGRALERGFRPGGGVRAKRPPLSVEWSRIQPTPDRWDEHALDYYREIVRGLLERGMTPMVTLHHFTNPLWLEERCGWECADMPKLFATYASRVVEALKEYVSLWVTINEPNVIVYSGYLSEDFPTTHKGLGPAFRVYENLVRGHAAAYAGHPRGAADSAGGDRAQLPRLHPCALVAADGPLGGGLAAPPL